MAPKVHDLFSSELRRAVHFAARISSAGNNLYTLVWYCFGFRTFQARAAQDSTGMDRTFDPSCFVDTG
jgi:hypothetical protein